jgi:hypothetical protein
MTTASQVNSSYLAQLNDPKSKMFSRIKDFWWDAFLTNYETDAGGCLDALDVSMNVGQQRLRETASAHAASCGFKDGTPEHAQRVSQVLKSSTGKMFERFIGLAISYSLLKADSRYAVWGFNSRISRWREDLSPKNFEVSMSLGRHSYSIPIDSDLVAFDPQDKSAPIYMLSIKSTLKDRFHNVPFWNMLRIGALTDDQNWRMTASNAPLLASVKYVAVCSDLASEQPDFGSLSGPRNLLCLDAALLDGAYVTAANAKGVVTSSNHLGANRDHPFAPLSCLVNQLGG